MSNSIDALIEVVARDFKANVKDALLEKMRAAVAPELERIAAEEAARIHNVVVTYYRDQRMMLDWLGFRLSINGTEVKSSESPSSL